MLILQNHYRGKDSFKNKPPAEATVASMVIMMERIKPVFKFDLLMTISSFFVSGFLLSVSQEYPDRYNFFYTPNAIQCVVPMLHSLACDVPNAILY